jgi:hypothetical protein
MIGGSPIFMPPAMPASRPAAKTGQVTPRAPAGGYVPPRLPAPQAQAQPAPRIARGARGEEPKRPSLTIPTPEELGITPVGRPGVVDWTATRRQLSELGAVRFGLEQLPGGKVRFSCLLPATGSERPALVQADGANESEAVRDVLEQARRQVARKR